MKDYQHMLNAWTEPLHDHNKINALITEGEDYLYLLDRCFDKAVTVLRQAQQPLVEVQ